MIEPISAATALASQLNKIAVEEVAKHTIKEILPSRLKELGRKAAIRGGSELGRMVMRAIGDAAEQYIRNEDGSPTIVGRLISSSTRSMAAKVPLERTIEKLISNSPFNTPLAKKTLMKMGIETSVFTGDKSLQKAFEGFKPPRTKTFIITGTEKLRDFYEALDNYADKKGLSVVPGRTFGIVGARAASMMPAREPLILELEALPDIIGIGRDKFRLDDLVRAGMSIDYATEVSLKYASVDPIEGLEVPGLAMERIAPERLAKISEALDCKEVTAARAWINGDDVNLAKMEAITPGDVKARTDRILQIGLNNYLVAKGEAPSRLNRQVLLSVSKLNKSKDLGPGSVDTVWDQIPKGPSGEFGRQLVADAFKPFFEKCIFEVPHSVGDRKTFADIRLIGARLPLRSHDFFVSKGGTLSIEVKTRKAPSLQSAKTEMLFQAGSREYSDAAISVVTKDIRDLSAATERGLRDELKDAAPVYKFLPRKELLDGTLEAYVEHLLNS